MTSSVSSTNSSPQESKLTRRKINLIKIPLFGSDGFHFAPSVPDRLVPPIIRGDGRTGPYSPESTGGGITTDADLQRINCPAVNEELRAQAVMRWLAGAAYAYQQLTCDKALLERLLKYLPAAHPLQDVDCLHDLLSNLPLEENGDQLVVHLPSHADNSSLIRRVWNVLNEAGKASMSLDLSKLASDEDALRKHLLLLADDLSQQSHVLKTLKQYGLSAEDAAEIVCCSNGDYGANEGRVLVYRAQQRLKFFHVASEDVEASTYWALVCREQVDGSSVSLEQVRFNRYAANESNQVFYLDRQADEWKAFGQHVLWVATGRPLVYSDDEGVGQPVDHANTVLTSDDVRHDFVLGKIDLPDGSVGWLGESALRADKARLRAAADSPIRFTEEELFVPLDAAIVALQEAGYEEVKHPLKSLQPRQYRIHPSPQGNELEVFLAKQRYPATALIISASGDLYAAAWQGPHGSPDGYNLSEFGIALTRLSETHEQIGPIIAGLLIDEGLDSTHLLGNDFQLAPGREKIRSVWIGIPLRLLVKAKGKDSRVELSDLVVDA